MSLFLDNPYLQNSHSRRPSFTALVPLLTRWMMHLQGIRSDASADKLVRALPSLNYELLRVGVGPALVVKKATEYLPEWAVPSEGKLSLANMLHERTLFFDSALIASLSTVEQVVILGAGFDTRLFEFCLSRGLALFEVDQKETQRVKKQALIKSGIDCGAVKFVAVDFAYENWMEVLISSGFESGKRTFFLWEGVTYYLTKAMVERAFSLMAEHSSKGSAVTFDFFSEELVTSTAGLAAAILDWIGEPLRFGVDGRTNGKEGIKAGLESLIAGTGFELGELRVVDSWTGSAFEPVSSDVLGGLAITQLSAQSKVSLRKDYP